MTPPRWTAFASFSSRRALWGLDHVRHRAHDGRAWLGRGRADRLCIVAAHDELVARCIDVSEIWHGPPFPAEARQAGPDPERASYGSFFSFNDPDGNTWLVQEVTTRRPGRMNAAETGYVSAADLEAALRRAQAAHHDHEKNSGGSHLLHRSSHDEDWPGWYAEYMAAEQAGTDLPS